jgi:putative transposase
VDGLGTLLLFSLSGNLRLVMPRQARLDAPGTLHHVMVRGLERRIIFRDDTDRADFVSRLATLATKGALTIYAWALLPDHAHLLLQTGSRPLARSMRSLLTGYAGAFNRRHRRVGHLFQNRYKSIVVEAEPYLLELVRYLHLNPLRAHVVPDLRALDRYPWAGHSALWGTVARPWQATREVLSQFGSRLPRARHAYREFVAAGIACGRRPDLQGGGLLRSQGGWAAVAALRRGREAYLGDERILGSSAFVEQVRHDLQAASPLPARRRPLADLIARVCAAAGSQCSALRQGSRRAAVARAREGIAYLALEVAGYSGRAVAEALGVRPSSVYRAAQRGHTASQRWDRLFP